MAKVVPERNSNETDVVEDVDVEGAGASTPNVGKRTAKDDMRSQLLMACETGDIALLNQYLESADREQVLATRDSQTWPLLAIAASRGHEELVHRLLDYGFPVDMQDEYGSTALYRAVGFRQNAVVKLLLSRGANMCHVNKDGNNIIHNSAYSCNDFATIQALKGGVDPTQPNARGRISLLDLVENQPHLARVYLDSKVKRLANYVQHSKMLYDFTGLDYKDSAGVMDSPLEAMISYPHSNFLLEHMLVKQFLTWQWRLYGKRFFVRNLAAHLAMLVLITYIAIVSKYKWMEAGGNVYNYHCCSSAADVMLDGVRAAAELLLLPVCTHAVWQEVDEYRKAGHVQVRLPQRGPVLQWLLPRLFRSDSDIHNTGNAVVAVPRYVLDVWNLLDLAALMLVAALGGIRVAAIVEQRQVLSPRAEANCMGVLVITVWVKLLAYAGVSRSTGPHLRVLRSMLIHFAKFSGLYLLFYVAVSIATFLVSGFSPPPSSGDGNGDGSDLPAADHTSILSCFITTFQVTLANADFSDYSDDVSLIIIFIIWTILSTLLLLSLVVAIFSYDYEVGEEVAEQEWLVVFGGYLLRTQRLLGDAEVQRLKAEDLQRCHAMGGFNTPVGEAKTNLPVLATSIPAKLYVTWEDTTTWPPAFRQQMESRFTYDDEDFQRAQAEAEDRQHQAQK